MSGKLLGPAAEAQIRKVVRRVLSESAYGTGFERPSTNKQPFRSGHVVQVSTAGITARSGMTPGTGTATVFERTTAGSLASVSTITETIFNLSTNSVPGSNYITAIQDNFGDFYTPAVQVSTAGSTGGHTAPPVYAVADAVLLPGTTTAVSFTKQTWSGGWTATTTTISVRDTAKQACYLVGEAGWFLTPDNGSNYFPAAEHGLRRLIKASTTAGTVDVNGSAPGKFVVNGTPSTANGNVTFENDFPGTYNRPIYQGENAIFWAQYDRTSSKWIVEPAPMSMFSVADAATQGIDPAAATVNLPGWRYQDWLANGSTGETTLNSGNWTNTHDIPSLASRPMFLWRSVASSVANWEVIQADLNKDDFHTDIQHSTASGQVQVKTRELWGHWSASESGWTNKIATTPCT